MIRGLMIPIKDIKPSETEFAALCLHLLWLNPCLDTITEETEKISTYWRRQLFTELQNYYLNSMGINCYGIRLGDFMGLMGSLEKIIFSKKEVILLSDFFSPSKFQSTLSSLFR